jgi:hypothetical protein
MINKANIGMGNITHSTYQTLTLHQHMDAPWAPKIPAEVTANTAAEKYISSNPQI